MSTEQTSEMEAENLDAMFPDELRAFGESLPIGTLRYYAFTKALAMEWRANGGIQSAMLLEKECEQLYKALPSHLKW